MLVSYLSLGRQLKRKWKFLCMYPEFYTKFFRWTFSKRFSKLPLGNRQPPLVFPKATALTYRINAKNRPFSGPALNLWNRERIFLLVIIQFRPPPAPFSRSDNVRALHGLLKRTLISEVALKSPNVLPILRSGFVSWKQIRTKLWNECNFEGYIKISSTTTPASIFIFTIHLVGI